MSLFDSCRREVSGGRYAGGLMSSVSSLVQQQLDAVREALRQARQLIGEQLVEPPTDIQADPNAAKNWVE